MASFNESTTLDLSRQQINEFKRRLPIWQYRDELLNAIRSKPHSVIVCSTGSGKTTQIPQFLLEAGYAKSGVIAITQVRCLKPCIVCMCYICMV
ncbi:unnamed protein product [Protopolystoma xenopodis]|uniref:Helicase ATP-binding domain-containing protein n=1 Tax=Protopolystoma xenopodis TaxID=117903 RepID=A0A3S5AIR2_9PLAT|nr:unnamed protein product [Protopolystoma xenopodis]